MSVNNFKKRPRLSITIDFACSGAFNPFVGAGTMNWELTGSVTGTTGVSNATERQITCQTDIGDDTVFGFFSIFPGSTGSNSGTVDTGVLPFKFPAVFKVNENAWVSENAWKVNTNPVLSEFGTLNGQPAPQSIYYLVALPDTPNAKADDPIVIDPAIDTLSRVYPGDFVAVDALQRWRVYPQRRLPKTDRTFLWEPNTSPVLESGGKVDGVLAKPGTIMIPTKNFYIEDPEDWIENYNYFHQGVGIMFDGQKWNNNVLAIVADKGPKIGEEFWPETIYVSDQIYEYRFEQDHYRKFRVFTNTQANSNVLSFKVTEGSSTTNYDAYFTFGRRFDVNDNLQGAPVFYDHGDSYSYSHKKRLEWYDENRVVQIDSAGGTVSVFFNPNDPAQSFAVGLNHFVDGNVTEWQETSVNDEGEEVVNNYRLNLSLVTIVV
jgi:hypothetical protein